VKESTRATARCSIVRMRLSQCVLVGDGMYLRLGARNWGRYSRQKRIEASAVCLKKERPLSSGKDLVPGPVERAIFLREPCSLGGSRWKRNIRKMAIPRHYRIYRSAQIIETLLE